MLDEKDFQELLKAAGKGDVAARCKVGFCYETGEGTEQDYHKAVEWYIKTAAQGDAGAQLNLGLCYERGNGWRKTELGKSGSLADQCGRAGRCRSAVLHGLLLRAGQRCGAKP